jgi:hypothetical protein
LRPLPGFARATLHAAPILERMVISQIAISNKEA